MSGFPDLRPERRTLRLMLSLELGEELYQSLHTLLGHGVIDGGPETTHGLVALQVIEAGLLGGGHHGGIQILVAGDEGDVHEAAVLRHHGTL